MNAAEYVIMGGLGVAGPEKLAIVCGDERLTYACVCAIPHGPSCGRASLCVVPPMEGSNKRRFFAVFASATNYVAGRSRKGGNRRAT